MTVAKAQHPSKPERRNLVVITAAADELDAVSDNMLLLHIDWDTERLPLV